MSADAGVAAELSGKPEEAARYYLWCVRMGLQVRRNGDLATALTGVAICSMGREPLHGLMANQRLSDETLRRVIAECRAAESLPGEIGPRLSAIPSIVGSLKSEEDWENAKRQLGSLKGSVWQPIPEMLNMDAKSISELPSLAKMKELEAQFRAAVAEAGTHPLADLVSDKPGMSAIIARHLPPGSMNGAVSRLLGIEALLGAAEQFATNDVILREVETQAAIILFQRKLGRDPRTLDELVPAFLPVVPEDTYAKAPLSYEQKKGNWKITSAGPFHEGNTGPRGELAMWSQTETNEQYRSGYRLVRADDKPVLMKVFSD